MRITLLIFIAIFQDLLSQAKDRKMGYYTTFWRPCLTLIDFITELFCRVDDDMKGVSKDPRSHLWPSELVSIGVLYVLKAQSQSRFYRWLKANYLDLFPRLPERSRLFRLLRIYQHWADRFLAHPGMMLVSDSLGIELIQPRRQGRSVQQVGEKGVSNGQWIVGIKYCVLLNFDGRICDWDADPASVYDGDFQRMLSEHPNEPKLVDNGFHISDKRGGDCENLIVCQRGQRNYRMVVETVFSGWVSIFGMKHIWERLWPGIESHLSFASAAWNLVTDMATELFGGDKKSLSTAWVPI